MRWHLLIAGVAGALGVWCWLNWLEQSYDQPFSLIEEGLYIGRAVDQPPKGTKAVVNLCGREDSYKSEAFLWEPVFEDGKEPSLEWLQRVVAFIAVQRQANRQVFVHCSAGMNRSGAVVTAYLMHEHGWGRDKALRFVQEKRSVVQPNSTLMRLLSEWETSLGRKGPE